LEISRIEGMGRGAFGEGCDMSVAGSIPGYGVDSMIYEEQRLYTM
jgi:hypothetical protein